MVKAGRILITDPRLLPPRGLADKVALSTEQREACRRVALPRIALRRAQAPQARARRRNRSWKRDAIQEFARSRYPHLASTARWIPDEVTTASFRGDLRAAWPECCAARGKGPCEVPGWSAVNEAVGRGST